MTVMEYRDRFLQLARYTPAEVADDHDKQEHFMKKRLTTAPVITREAFDFFAREECSIHMD